MPGRERIRDKPSQHGKALAVHYPNGITPNSETVGIYLNVRDGTGTAWFDDVELVESPIQSK